MNSCKILVCIWKVHVYEIWRRVNVRLLLPYRLSLPSQHCSVLTHNIVCGTRISRSVSILRGFRSSGANYCLDSSHNMDWEVLESDQPEIGPESRLYRPKSRLKASSKPTDPDVRSKLPSRKLFLNEAPTGFESFDVRRLAQNLALDDLKASSKFTDPDVRSTFTSLSRLIRDKARIGFDVRKPALIDSKASFTPTNPDGRSRLTSRKLVLDDSKASFTPTGSTLTNPEIRTTTKTILPVN